MEIHIILPYENSDTMAPVWAFEEERIHFRTDTSRAARCTSSYAAMELKKYIMLTVRNAEVTIGSGKIPNSFNIMLSTSDPSSRSDEFTLEPDNNSVAIYGKGRTGLLYGAYELLRMQGWRWYAPGDEGEVRPAWRVSLTLPEKRMDFAPSMSGGRGFDFENCSEDSAKFWVWMSRNRMNVAAWRPYTAALCDKLGMQFKDGGHIFEKCLEPERVLPSGKTLWDEHRDWYGVGADGTRRKDTALSVQFCVSNESLLDFLFEYLLEHLNGVWKHDDRIDIWGFDTWGRTCGCAACQALGNGSDQYLHFVSRIRSRIDEARRDGRLNHDVKLVFCGYEGTCTIEAPVNPIPENIIAAGDLLVYYPIRRCYAHGFNDKSCEINAFYNHSLYAWLKLNPSPSVVIGEYYNVSKFEDLPIIFSKRISEDIPYYHHIGIRGATYMHVPLVNWGMRTLTQVLYAQLCWDAGTDVEEFLAEYFLNWYGPYAKPMRKGYELVEEAWLCCADWRSWGPRSVLTQLLAWDGNKPQKRLSLDNHFKTGDIAVDNGRESVVLIEKALEIIGQVRTSDKAQSANDIAECAAVGVNPAEDHKYRDSGKYTLRIGEDMRSLIYALDTMRLMTALTAYHEALYHNESDNADKLWTEIEKREDALDRYYIPIGYDYPSSGLVSKDALTRTQLREVIVRCRKKRIETGMC